MNEKKTIISVKWEYGYRKSYDERIEVRKDFELELSGETTLRDIENFYENLENVFKSYKKEHKKVFTNGVWYRMEIDVLKLYDDRESAYDRWVSQYYTDQDGEGIFLEPDTKYTDASRTIYLTKNIFKDLASYVV